MSGATDSGKLVRKNVSILGEKPQTNNNSNNTQEHQFKLDSIIDDCEATKKPILEEFKSEFLDLVAQAKS